MLKKLIFLFFINSNILINSVKAEELNIFQENSRKFNLSICAIFKNEAPHLKEWIEFHRIFGVDHFYLYNIGSFDSYSDILKPYIEEDVVTLIHWPEAIVYQDDKNVYRWALSTQIPAYENAVNFKARNETKWLVFVDINEFLVCPVGNNIADLLKKYDDFPGISFSSYCFDASIPTIHKRKLLIQTIILTRQPPEIVDKTVKKMIFKPDLCTGFIWPPYECRFKNFQSSIVLDHKELRVNRYINRNIKYTPFAKVKDRLFVDNRFLSEDETSLLLEEGYVIEDLDRPIYQYVPELLKKMRLK